MSKIISGSLDIYAIAKQNYLWYNTLPMRPFRLITGFLTFSLLLGGALSDVLHIQEKSEAQASAHLMEHIDSVDKVAIDSSTSDLDGEGCYENSPQVAITTPSGQRTSITGAIGLAPHLITKIVHHPTEALHTFRGRDAPLFEYASLFAATVSMRV